MPDALDKIAHCSVPHSRHIAEIVNNSDVGTTSSAAAAINITGLAASVL